MKNIILSLVAISTLAFLPNISLTAQTYTKSTFTGGMTNLSAYDVTVWDGGSGTYDDNVSGAQSIGFTFNYFGNDYTQFYLSTNGWLSFTSPGVSDPSNDAIPTAGSTENMLAPWWDDLIIQNQGSADKVGYALSGSAPNRILTVEYFSVSRYGGAGEYYYFQTKIYETTNVIEFHYSGTYTLNGSETVSIGIENSDGTIGYVGPAGSPSISAWPTVNYRFTPDANDPTSPIFYNTGAIASFQTTFNHQSENDLTPEFTLSSTYSGSMDRFVIELNTKSDFTGTSYTQTFSGTYSSGTKYDFTCDGLSSNLPTTSQPYFVRAKASADAGFTYGNWSTDTWVYTYTPTAFGYHFTTEEQFNLGSLISTNYGNFISVNDNGTATNFEDDYVEVNEGTSTNLVATKSDHTLTEDLQYYDCCNFNTIGSYYSTYQEDDYNGFRFTSADIPQGATINTASLTIYAHHTGSEPVPDNTNPLYLKVRGVDQDNCSSWANSTSTSTGQPLYRTRTTAGVDWDIAASWTDLSSHTSPDISTVVQEIVDRGSYSAGNALGLIIDYDGAAHGSANRHRYISTENRGAAYKARLNTTFTNFENEIQFPDMALANFVGGTSWDELVFDDETGACGACDITYSVHNAVTDALIASGTSSPVDLGDNTATSIYVIAKLKRNSSPKLNSFTVKANGSVLPVELTDFEVACAGNGVDVSWETAIETNNKGFIIQSSTDGKEFKDVEFTEGFGTSSEPHYYSQFIEGSGVEYYRLKQVDFNGNSKYSEVQYVECETDKLNDVSVNVYPNPVSNNLTILFEGNLRTESQFKIVNLLGKVVRTGVLNSDMSTVDVSMLAAGSYFLQLEYNNHKEQFKIVKAK